MARDLIKADGPDAIIREIAMDIGKETVAYVEVMYPKAIEATSSTFKLSLRNHIYNQIMAAIQVTDEGLAVARLNRRKKDRRAWLKTYRGIRKAGTGPVSETKLRELIANASGDE